MPRTGAATFHYYPLAQPRIPFKLKDTFKGTLDENVVNFLDLFKTQRTLAWVTDADCLLLLPACMADRAARWYHHKKDTHSTYGPYLELWAALKWQFTP